MPSYSSTHDDLQWEHREFKPQATSDVRHPLIVISWQKYVISPQL